MRDLRSTLEKTQALIRQGFRKEAMNELDRLIKHIDSKNADVVIEPTKFDDDDEITLELAIPTDVPTVDFEITRDGVSVIIDEEDQWNIPESLVTQVCLPLQESEEEVYSKATLNTYKMSMTAKLKELVMQGKIVKRLDT